MLLLGLLCSLLAVVAEGCNFPEQLIGQWDGTLPGWKDLTITNTTIGPLLANLKTLYFKCYSQNGTTYIIQSDVHEVSSITYHYYVCLDIVPSDTNLDVVFFRVLTEKNPRHFNDTVVSVLTTENKTASAICQKPSTEVPLLYNVFLRKGFEGNLENESCPSSLQAEFVVNFTDSLTFRKCPNGFELSGCDRRHLMFDYSNCSDQASFGSVNYTCWNTIVVGPTTYTTISSPQQTTGTEQTNAYEIACLEQTTTGGQLSITKSSGTCGSNDAVDMIANETLSCREPTTVSPETTTQAGTSSAQTSAAGSLGSTAGNGDQGAENPAKGCGTAAAIPGIFMLLFPALVAVLAFGFP